MEQQAMGDKTMPTDAELQWLEEQARMGMGDDGAAIDEEEAAWLEEQMAAQMGGCCIAPPSFIATNFTTRREYDAWLSAGANVAA